MTETHKTKGTVSFVSLGCSKNLVDSERMLGLLAQDGFALVPEGQQADLVIVNTCGFIDAARQESCGVIEEMLERKRAGTVKGVVVAGCLAERQKDLLLEQFPEVDQVVGVFGREEIARVSERILGGLDEQRTLFRPAPVQAQDDRARLRITPRHLAYLKVSEGCDRLCTFCAIPYMRGKHVTKPIERVVEEARELAGDGVRELILVAQDMTYYGVDLYGRPRLAELLRELDQIEELDWIRILYNYPELLHRRALRGAGQRAADHPVPRHAAPAHQRPAAQDDEPAAHPGRDRGDHRPAAGDDAGPGAPDHLHRRLPRRDRGRVPGTARLRGRDPVRAARRLRPTRSSPTPRRPSSRTSLPDAVKEERRERVMAVQQPIAEAFNRTLVGRTLDVLIDAPAPQGKNLWLGRTYADAPDVDGLTLVQAARPAARRPGRPARSWRPRATTWWPGRSPPRPRGESGPGPGRGRGPRRR